MSDASDYPTVLDPSGKPYAITIPVRVRYVECDPMRVAHHSSYVAWLEMSRTELLRARGFAYKDLEASGVLMVVARLSLKYRRPARYDDVLDVYCEARPTAGVKLVCVDENGRMRPVPEALIT